MAGTDPPTGAGAGAGPASDADPPTGAGPSELIAPPVSLSWLIGEWEGLGRTAEGRPGPASFIARLRVSPAGGGLLRHEALRWVRADDGSRGALIAAESGFWRPASALAGALTTVEVVLTDGEGIAAAWTGVTEVLSVDGSHVTSARVRLVTDAVARTPSAPRIAGGERLYGLFDGALMWTEDLATEGDPAGPEAATLVNIRWGRLDPLSAAADLHASNGR